MKKLLLAIGFSFGFANAAGFVSPITFDGSDAQKKAVIAYIEQRVKEQSAVIGSESASMSRMLEDAALKAFKKLTKAEDKKTLKEVINTYCDSVIDMCSYPTIKMMYDREVKSKKKKLEW